MHSKVENLRLGQPYWRKRQFEDLARKCAIKARRDKRVLLGIDNEKIKPNSWAQGAN